MAIKYISYEEVLLIHIILMNKLGETRFGIDFRELLESALARPRNSAIYETANLIRQAATLCFGLIKNHPFTGGNKRTATTLMRRFLEINGYRKKWKASDQIELVLKVEADIWKVDEIESGI